jgi:hypothetical protein
VNMNPESVRILQNGDLVIVRTRNGDESNAVLTSRKRRQSAASLERSKVDDVKAKVASKKRRRESSNESVDKNVRNDVKNVIVDENVVRKKVKNGGGKSEGN